MRYFIIFSLVLLGCSDNTTPDSTVGDTGVTVDTTPQDIPMVPQDVPPNIDAGDVPSTP